MRRKREKKKVRRKNREESRKKREERRNQKERERKVMHETYCVLLFHQLPKTSNAQIPFNAMHPRF